MQCAVHLLPSVGEAAQLHPWVAVDLRCKQCFPVVSSSKLLLYERNWLNRWKTSVLHEGEGSITNIQWRVNLIAWANNVVSDQSQETIKHTVLNVKMLKSVFPDFFKGVKIYDIGTKQRITNVLRDNVSLRPDMYPCSLCWKDNATLIVGWGTSIKVCFFSLKLH